MKINEREKCRDGSKRDGGVSRKWTIILYSGGGKIQMGGVRQLNTLAGGA